METDTKEHLGFCSHQTTGQISNLMETKMNKIAIAILATSVAVTSVAPTTANAGFDIGAVAGFAIGAMAAASAARRPVVVYHDRVVHHHEAVKTVTKVVHDPAPVHQTQTQQTQSTSNTTTSIGNPNIVINVTPNGVTPNNDKDRPVAVLPQEQKPQTTLLDAVSQTNSNAHASDGCTAYVMAHSTNMSHDDATREAATVCNH
jgi:hypothetical protein